MKYLYQLFVVLFCALNLVGCGDEDFIEIDSLNANGDEFYCNQKVKLWMCVRSSDLWHTDYQWSCDGGTLTQPQGLNEMTWKAPRTPGVYTITCTASIGGEKQTRSHKMYVSRYYFDTFENTSHSLSLQSNTKSSLKKESNGNQYLQASVNTSSEVNRYIRHSFDDDALCTPFSTRMKLGFDKDAPTTHIITAGKKTGLATFEYRWNLRSHSSNNGAYLNQIRMIWFPAPLKEYPTVPEESVVVEGTPDYNVQVSVQFTGSDGVKKTYNEYHKLNTLNVFKNKVYKNVSMSVDENEQLYVYVDGAEALQTNLVRQVRTENACEGVISINNWELYIMNGDDGKKIPQVYIDDTEASVTEILK